MRAALSKIMREFLFPTVGVVLIGLMSTVAFIPSARKTLLHTLGVSMNDDSKLVLNKCLADQKNDADQIYFVSCGGIY